MALRLLPELSVVASGSLGFSLTDKYDCNCYLWEYADGEYVLFDSGAGRNIEPMLQQIEEIVRDLTRIKYICLTHHHADHMGGAAVIRRISGAKVVASAHSAPLIAAGDEDAIGLTASRAKGGYPADYSIEGCPVDIVAEEGRDLQFGARRVGIIATPGHCNGAISFILELNGKKALVSGDVVFPGGKISLLNLPDCSITEYGETITALTQLKIDMLLPGHAGVLMSAAAEHIEIAFNYFDKLVVPPCL